MLHKKSHLFFKEAFRRKFLFLAKAQRDSTTDEKIIMLLTGVKGIAGEAGNHRSMMGQDIELRAAEINLIRVIMTELTPRQFMNVFPIIKDYDGKKTGTKDYFYTIEKINAMGWDEPISEKLEEFLWDYQNHDVSFFLVAQMVLVSDIMASQGNPRLSETMAADLGISLFYNDGDKQFYGPVYPKRVDNGELFFDDSKASVLSTKRTTHLRCIPGGKIKKEPEA